ncbi:MAG: DUF4386 domain-containing protein [Rhizobiaceae bacterium]|nr:DUF4386 domain-containing protein [Rhizobiaceae bacterium]
MTTISTSAQAAPVRTDAGSTAASRSRQDQHQLLGRLTGLMFIVTFATAIPPVVTFYVPALTDPAFVLGGGFDTGVSWGALLELLLIMANIVTALALYPVLKRRFPVLSLGFVAARLMESTFIAVGIVALMALNTLRIQAGDSDPDALVAVGKSLVAVHDWTFRMGPGMVVGVGNGLILGAMMWKSRLVPRFLSVFGLIGGPALLVAGTAVLFGIIEAGSGWQVLATAPEFLWELSLGVWLLARGFNAAALAALGARQA